MKIIRFVRKDRRLEGKLEIFFLGGGVGLEMGLFRRIYTKWGGGFFLGKMGGGLDGEMREKVVWMSGAAARTGDLK